jgi:hypothetical protein
MAPLHDPALMDDACEDVFSLWPMKVELDAAIWDAARAKNVPTVQFRMDVEIVNPFTEYYTDDDIATKWFLPDELFDIKQRAKEESCEIRKATKGQETSLCVAHRKTSLMLKSDFKSLIKLSPTTPDEDLTEWCSADDGRRGLERFASRDYAALRRNDIFNTRTAVMEAYARQQSLFIKDPEAIAIIARDASRRARTFARFFAAADAGAAKTPDEPIRRLPPRCHSEVRTISRRAPPRKRSKQYHRQELFSLTTSC